MEHVSYIPHVNFEFGSLQIWNLPVAKHSVDLADIDSSARAYMLANHKEYIRHVWASNGDMVDMPNCAIHLDERDGYCCQNVEASGKDWDFAWISPDCGPWSSLSNRDDRGTPDQEKEFQTCFGETNSAAALTLERMPKVICMEEVTGFATVKDSTGYTGLERLVAVIMKKRRNGKRYYQGWAAIEMETAHWGGASRKRLPYDM